MAAPRQIDEQVFIEAVPISLAFLVSDLGFSFTQRYSYLFEAKSRDCRINIQLDRGYASVDILPARPDQISPKSDWPVEISLMEIVSVLNPKFDYERDRLIGDIRSQVDAVAELLQTFCLPVLKGDFSIWSKVKVSREKWKGTRLLEEEQAARNFRLGRIRLQAEAAFKKKDYAKAAKLYESIRDDLLPSEFKKLEYAKKYSERPS